MCRLLAPFTSFIAEELYQNLVRSINSNTKESVHLTDFPIADITKIDDKLSSNVELAMKISSLGRAARAKAGVKVRQPLAKAVVKVNSKAEREALHISAADILEEINVKQIEFSSEESFSGMPGYSVASDARYWVAVNVELTPELVSEGVTREIVRRLQNMRRTADFDIADHIVIYYQSEEPIRQAMTDFKDYINQETLSRDIINKTPPEGAHIEKHRILNTDVLLAVKKATPES